MMSKLIQWPRAQYWDKPWNPIIGCKPCSPACENCYAASMMRRFGKTDFSPYATTKLNPPRKGVVFCGNMTDLFGEWCSPLNYLRKTWSMASATYLYLTKRTWHMCNCLSFINADYSLVHFDNHYFGFTAENQEWYDSRRDAIYGKWPSWANLWISCEPLLGNIDLNLFNAVRHSWLNAGSQVKWLVVGCESGPNRRPCKLEWVESIVDQCRAAGVPVFVKQLDLNGKCERNITKFPKHLQIRQVPWAKEGESK